MEPAPELLEGGGGGAGTDPGVFGPPAVCEPSEETADSDEKTKTKKPRKMTWAPPKNLTFAGNKKKGGASEVLIVKIVLEPQTWTMHWCMPHHQVFRLQLGDQQEMEENNRRKNWPALDDSAL